MSEYSHRFKTYKKQIDFYLLSVLNQRKNGSEMPSPQSLYDPIRYTLEGKGKRIRPILLLLSCEALGGSVEQALPAAAAVELMHNFTLVHDDIMDHDDTRRGRLTVHRKWNTEAAILAGDGLVVLAYKSLLRTKTPRLKQICQIFTDGILEICEGQALDGDFEQDDGVTMARYEEMILKKTSRLLAICAQIGAILGGARPEQVEIFHNFAKHLGLAFQVQDDLLDITTEQAVLGKDFGSDIKRRKRTFLYVHAMEHGHGEHRQALKDIYTKPAAIEQDDILSAQRIFYRAGAIQAAQKAVRQHIDTANQSLDQLRPAVDTASLADLARMILYRNA